MSNKIKIISVGSVASLVAGVLLPTAALAATPDVSSNINSLVDYLKANQDASGKITGFGGETSWTVMGMVAAGVDPSTVENSGNSLLDFLAANPPGDTAATGWERDLLAITAVGENPFTFGGRNYVEKVESFANNNQIGSVTTLNDDIFGVLSLVSAGPSADQVIISDSLDFIITNQNVDGGWSWSVGGSSDTNDTAIAVQALKAAKVAGFTNTGIIGAIDDAITYLLGLQQADGGWEYQAGFGTDGASTSWVIQALIGEDTAVTNGLNFLISLQEVNGGVQYQSGFGADTFTSGYALSAFAQQSFPIGVFDEEFEEPTDNSQEPSNPNNQNPGNNNQTRDDGDVLAEVDGEVLAATLPETGISSNLPSVGGELEHHDYLPASPLLRFVGLFLALGSSLILAGIAIHRTYNKQIKYDIK